MMKRFPNPTFDYSWLYFHIYIYVYTYTYSGESPMKPWVWLVYIIHLLTLADLKKSSSLTLWRFSDLGRADFPKPFGVMNGLRQAVLSNIGIDR